MKLVTEYTEQDLTATITEAKGAVPSKYTLEGIFMQADQLNHNRRVYPKHVLETAVDKYVSEYVSRGRAVGELNHPEGPSINLDKVSHRITELTWNGSNVMGKALVLNTPMGQIVKGLMEGGCQLGVSSRGMGSVSSNRDSTTTVEKGFVLSTVDIVQDPSAPSAFVNGIMEGMEFFYEGSNIVCVASEKAKEKFQNISTKEINERKAEIFKDFMHEISDGYNFK